MQVEDGVGGQGEGEGHAGVVCGGLWVMGIWREAENLEEPEIVGNGDGGERVVYLAR